MHRSTGRGQQWKWKRGAIYDLVLDHLVPRKECMEKLKKYFLKKTCTSGPGKEHASQPCTSSMPSMIGLPPHEWLGHYLT
mmetsp:Transcript_36557/g.91027  ORF Transcript_36557/g.91027 Transcript_36557/m.91027 type:complete len:80 (+) Transcript_36557:310-549(+)